MTTIESAQAMDELRGGVTPDGVPQKVASPLAQLSQVEGVEFVLTMKVGTSGHELARGLENPERMATWARQNLERFRSLGDNLGAGTLEQIEGFGPQRHVALACQGDTEFCVGWKHSLAPDQIRELMRKVMALWGS